MAEFREGQPIIYWEDAEDMEVGRDESKRGNIITRSQFESPNIQESWAIETADGRNIILPLDRISPLRGCDMKQQTSGSSGSAVSKDAIQRDGKHCEGTAQIGYWRGIYGVWIVDDIGNVTGAKEFMQRRIAKMEADGKATLETPASVDSPAELRRLIETLVDANGKLANFATVNFGDDEFKKTMEAVNAVRALLLVVADINR